MWKRRLIALFLGTVFTFAAAECLLAGSQWFFVKYQRHRNMVSLSEAQDNEIRILAIGESTTAVAGNENGNVLVPQTSYPAHLQRILNERQDGRTYRVLNNGMMGGDTPALMELLQRSIGEFDPHIVIAMMGIKDRITRKAQEEEQAGPPRPHWSQRLHTVQLWEWLQESRQLRQNAAPEVFDSPEQLPAALRVHQYRMAKFVKESRMVLHEGDDDLYQDVAAKLELATFYWYTGKHRTAEKILTATIENHDLGYNLLGNVLLTDNRSKEARELMSVAISKHPKEGMYREMLARVLTSEDNFEAAEAVLAQAFEDSDGFYHSATVIGHLKLMEASLAHKQGQFDRAIEILQAIKPTPEQGSSPSPKRFSVWFPPLERLINSQMGETYLSLGEWELARVELESAVSHNPLYGANVWMLAQALRELGMQKKEMHFRKFVRKQTQRMASYFETAKMFRLYGTEEQIHSLFLHASENIPSVAESYQTLYDLGEQHGFQIMVMQYPSFSLENHHIFAPPKEGVEFIDNEHVFEEDPERYFYEPRFPYSYSHYTKKGAEVLADHVADHVLALKTLTPPSP